MYVQYCAYYIAKKLQTRVVCDLNSTQKYLKPMTS